mmetsp:Transcript_28730/g.46212  ORF Transcript_28730/g.46212 Transcript_28730/m.46212 type:complete len:84 (-) Transcript_28730:94-345(-)
MRMSHVTHMNANELWRGGERQASHVTRVNNAAKEPNIAANEPNIAAKEPYIASKEPYTSHIWMRHVTPRIRMGHVTHMNADES